MSDVSVEIKKDETPESKQICDVLATLESLMTAVLPMKREGYAEGTIWVPALSQESIDEVEGKIMQMVRKLK